MKTELMERYMKESGRLPYFLDADGNRVWRESFIQFLIKPYEELEQEIATLRAKLTWNPMTENPHFNDRYAVIYKQGNIVKRFIADYDAVFGWNNPLPDVQLLGWAYLLPIPENQKEAL